MTIDATVAGASANSYITEAEAALFADTDLGRNAKAWASATDEQKEAALRRATAELDQVIGTVPLAYSQTQALLFPRSIDVIYGTSTPMIPTRLKRATYLQAAFLLRNADVIDDAVSFRARGLSSFSNPEGTGGTVAEWSGPLIDPRAQAIIDEIGGGTIIGTIVTT